MSSRAVSLSSALDRLQSWGDEPTVNPMTRKVESPRVPVPANGPGPARFASLLACTFFALAAILVVWLVTTSPSVGFIYAQF